MLFDDSLKELVEFRETMPHDCCDGFLKGKFISRDDRISPTFLMRLVWRKRNGNCFFVCHDKWSNLANRRNFGIAALLVHISTSIIRLSTFSRRPTSTARQRQRVPGAFCKAPSNAETFSRTTCSIRSYQHKKGLFTDFTRRLTFIT